MKDSLLTLKVKGDNSSKGEIIFKISAKGEWSDKGEGLKLTENDGRYGPKLGDNFIPKSVLCPHVYPSNFVHLVKGKVDHGRCRPKL